MIRPHRLDHAGQEGARQPEAGVQIGVQHRVPLGIIDVQQGAMGAQAGIVDEDVDRAEPRQGGGGKAVGALPRADVAHQHVRLGPERADLVRHRLARCLVGAAGVTRRLAAAEQELTELSGKSVPGRLVDVLGRLASNHGIDEPDGTLRIGMNLTHKDLADLIGTSRETLTKELAVLVDIGLLRVAHKTVTLVQPQAFPYVRVRRREPH